MGLNIYPPVSSGGAVWGDITGTLSDQTDLQSALDAKLASASILRSYLASTVTYNNVDVLANTALSVTVAAGGIYEIELNIYSTSAVNPLKMDFGGTATITNFVGQWNAQQATDIAAGNWLGVTAATTDFAVVPGGVDTFTKFTGSIEVNAAGTFLLRGAQQSADASNTTILRGSMLTLTKMN